MTQQLKEELLSFFIKVEIAMREYNFAVTSSKYIDPYSHMRNIEKIKNISSELKKKIEEL